MRFISWPNITALQYRAYALQSKLLPKNKTKNTKMLDGSEKSMMPILLANRGSIIKHDKKVLAREEFSAGTGIADVVMFSVDDKVLSKRLKKHRAALTDYRILSTYLAISRSPDITLGELVSKLNFSKKAISEDIIPTLTEASLITTSGGSYKCISGEIQQSPVTKCVAIEAKVKDWKGGIKQACRYKEFADETYLAIYKQHSAVPLKNIAFFQALNVGLLIVDDGHVEMAFQPDTSRFNMFNRLLASERLISSLDNFNQPFMPREPFATNRH